MKVVIHVNHAEHQRTNAGWIKQGMERHGLKPEFRPFDAPVECDLAVVWGWRQFRVKAFCRDAGIPILVMERGHVQPRMHFTSCGFGGLGNRARYPKASDHGARWDKLFAHHLEPWRQHRGKFMLLCGQVAGDASIYGVDFRKWAQKATTLLRDVGHNVRYRPHPLSVRHIDNWCPNGAELSVAGSLSEDLADATGAVVFNSTAGVEAVLAGVPVIAMDEGAMVWPVASHLLEAPLIRPDRTQWCHDLAWTQWSPEELREGTAWDALKTALQ